jgi:hypothetical protein
MKTVSIVIAGVLFALCQDLAAQTFDFRNTTWGMDSLQVKKAETARYISSNTNSITYTGRLNDLDAKIVYEFTSGGQLYQTFYLISLNSSNPSLYVNNFLLLQDLLTTKYKDPYKVLTATINGKVITQDEWASNLNSDNLNLETRWKNDRTDIVLSLYSVSDGFWIERRYTSLEFDKRADTEKKSSILKDL